MGLIAKNAEKIIEARMKGYRPADMVLVFLEDALTSNNPAVYAKPETAYDWRWVRGLDVCVYVSDADDWGHLAKAIALQRPDYLAIWNYEGKWGARVYLIPTASDVRQPVRYWRYDLDFTPWMDFQNADFIAKRQYERNEYGVPYAVG